MNVGSGGCDEWRRANPQASFPSISYRDSQAGSLRHLMVDPKIQLEKNASQTLVSKQVRTAHADPAAHFL